MGKRVTFYIIQNVNYQNHDFGTLHVGFGEERLKDQHRHDATRHSDRDGVCVSVCDRRRLSAVELLR